MTFYDRIAKYYDMAQEQLVSYQMEAQRMDAVFREHEVETILDMACGTGSHLVELAKLGYRCTGQDLSSGMINVAKKKARTCGLNIEFVKGNMCSYRLNRTFDAVLGLYALTNLVNEEDFSAALASARKALHSGGVFVFNVLNADAKGPYPPGINPPPQLFLGVTAAEASTNLVRVDNLTIQGNLWTLTGIYLIDDDGETRLEIHDDQLRLRRLDDVKVLLADHSLHFESVTYEDAMGYKRCDMHICAIAGDKR